MSKQKPIRFNAWLYKKHKKMLDVLSKHEGVSKSEIIRALIEELYGQYTQ